jgi:hypothetical protein
MQTKAIGSRDIDREAYTRSSVYVRQTIPAGETIHVSAFGETFYFIGLTAPVNVRTDVTSMKPYRQGTGEVFPPELRFRSLDIENPNAGPVQLVLWVGFGEYIDRRTALVDGFTVALGSPFNNVPAMTARTFNGVPSGNQLHRKAITVTNLDLANPLLVRDGSANVICAVLPNTSLILPISGPVDIYNATGSSIAAYMGEIWYVENAQ